MPDYANAAAPPPAIDGADLLDRLLAALKNYVVFPDDHAAVAVTLWTAATHCVTSFQHATRLVINSPEKRCGKSRLLDIICATCHRSLISVNATVAAIYRSLGGDDPPTLVIDEADAIFGTKKQAEQNEDLRALLNAGFQRDRPALRCVGPHQIPTEFPTFAMAALAGIGDMPDTITDRAVNVTMRRRAAGEKVAQFRARRDKPKLEALRDELSAWAGVNLDALAAAEPHMPVEDRAADTWEPLIAVADRAGGDWPAKARAACKSLVDGSSDSDEEGSLSVRLLHDIRRVFAGPFMTTGDLVDKLRGLEESPWDDFDLNARKLAQRLRPFGVKPGVSTTGSVRGYRIDTLTDAFARYLRQNPSDPSESADDQATPSDASDTSDASTRQTRFTRQNESADQGMFLTDLTGSDAPSAVVSIRNKTRAASKAVADPPCIHCGKPCVGKQRDTEGRPAHLGCITEHQPERQLV